VTPRMRAVLPWWLLGLLASIVIIAISTRISRNMTLWGIAASALLLAWAWSHFTREPPDE
jgi:hypothetical protein